MHLYFTIIFLSLSFSSLFCSPKQTRQTTSYGQICDASAAVPLGPNHFIVADDESNKLHIYARSGTGQPVSIQSISKQLAIRPGSKNEEADLEGAAAIGDTTYWITSHGRNKNGKYRANRHRFLALIVKPSSPKGELRHVGVTYRNLLKDLMDYDAHYGLGLHEASRLDSLNRKKKIAKMRHLAPKATGTNIEGLCRNKNGQGLLIGFRNPRPAGKALLVPMQNPQDVLLKSSKPIFAPPFLLDLNDLGIRSIALNDVDGNYYIIAGPHHSKRGSMLYRWSGERGEKPQLLQAVNGLNPEALIFYKKFSMMQLLSDDGTLPDLSGAGDCKDLDDPAQKSFRSIVFQLDAFAEKR